MVEAPRVRRVRRAAPVVEHVVAAPVARRQRRRVIRESTSTETEVIVNKHKPPTRVRKVIHE